jgi:hypothetical protein
MSGNVATPTSLAGSERCVSQVDRCQARAVNLARRVNGLVIHRPPGPQIDALVAAVQQVRTRAMGE